MRRGTLGAGAVGEMGELPVGEGITLNVDYETYFKISSVSSPGLCLLPNIFPSQQEGHILQGIQGKQWRHYESLDEEGVVSLGQV